MSARTPRQALTLLAADLQRTVSCVTRSVLRVDAISSDRASIAFGHEGRAAAGRGGTRWISVTVAVETRKAPDDPSEWLTQTLLYDFSLFDHASEGDFLLAYHFHPGPELGVAREPHLHIGARPAWAGRTLKKVHLPTGRVSCEAFVRLLIEELGVGRARANWDVLLRQSEANFAARRTW